MNETRKHHEFSPSKLNRIESCPWSYKNCINWESESGEDANRGTLLHEAIYDDTAYEQLNEHEKGVIDFIREEHIIPYASRKDLQHYHEMKVQVHDRNGELITEGYLDDLVVSSDGKVASLKDWKFGSYQVKSADKNFQMKAYVCGVFEMFKQIEKVYAMIVQPVYGSADYDNQTLYTRDMYDNLVGELLSIVEKAKNATENDTVPNADNCRYCNRNNCKAHRAKMIENFSVLAINSGELTEPERELTLDFADRLMLAKKEIESLMETRTELAKKVIIDAGGSANFRVQGGRITKKTDWKKLVADFGIPQDAVDAVTTEHESDPYLVPRMNKRSKLING